LYFHNAIIKKLAVEPIFSLGSEIKVRFACFGKSLPRAKAHLEFNDREMLSS